jgi:ATP-dependent DNA ligase
VAQGAARRQCGHAAHVHGLRCLQLDEGDLRSQALHVRRKRLEYVLDRGPAVRLPVRRLSDDGLKAWQQVLEHGYEGLVS